MKKNQNISKDTLTTYNVVRKEPRFGLISPVTKVIPNKKHPRTKHKGKQFDFD